MLADEEKNNILRGFKELEGIRSNGVLIGETAKANVDSLEMLRNSTDSIPPVLRTALVINWPEVAMNKRYDRFRNQFPEIDSLSKLKDAIDISTPLDFCVTYLDIKANPNSADKNPKFVLLKTLTEGFLNYQLSQGITSEIEAMRHWAETVNIKELRYDPIGKLKGVGLATVENIRLNLGFAIVKPDRHVIGVAQKELRISVDPSDYTELARFLGINPRRFDSVLFEYGKLMGISST